MTRYDLLIRHGTLVTEAGAGQADLGVADGKIVAMSPELEGAGRDEIDATGLHLVPGVIDAHVHFNEPGRTEWEGFASGTSALAAGGGTTCFDMPLNAHPPTLDAASFDAKRDAAKAAAVTDFALWGGLVPGNLDRLEELAERGVIGLKAFMANSGIADFPAVDDETLGEGMRRAATLGLIVAVHAESEEITARLAAEARAAGQTGMADFLASRPVAAEVAAIERAIQLASETECALHVVHVSSGAGVAAIAAARTRGLDVSCETCPHYLAFTEDDLAALGAVAKCAPPLRPAAEREALWQHLRDGTIPMVASDHSPAPPDLKTDPNFFQVWGGISGCQSLLPFLLSEGYHERSLPLRTVASIAAGFVARRFGLPGKGRLAAGADADLAIVNLDDRFVLAGSDLFYRHRQSPFVGRSFRGRVVRTILRGTTTFRNGQITASPIGQLQRPARSA